MARSIAHFLLISSSDSQSCFRSAKLSEQCFAFNDFPSHSRSAKLLSKGRFKRLPSLNSTDRSRPRCFALNNLRVPIKFEHPWHRSYMPDFPRDNEPPPLCRVRRNDRICGDKTRAASGASLRRPGSFERLLSAPKIHACWPVDYSINTVHTHRRATCSSRQCKLRESLGASEEERERNRIARLSRASLANIDENTRAPSGGSQVWPT